MDLQDQCVCKKNVRFKKIAERRGGEGGKAVLWKKKNNTMERQAREREYKRKGKQDEGGRGRERVVDIIYFICLSMSLLLNTMKKKKEKKRKKERKKRDVYQSSSLFMAASMAASRAMAANKLDAVKSCSRFCAITLSSFSLMAET